MLPNFDRKFGKDFYGVDPRSGEILPLWRNFKTLFLAVWLIFFIICKLLNIEEIIYPSGRSVKEHREGFQTM